MLISIGQSLDEAVNNPAIPANLRDQVRVTIESERTIILRDPRILSGRSREDGEWLNEEDRSQWYYWPRLREYLIDVKGWPEASVRSVDNATDRILGQMEKPSEARFDTRGLVLGHVQSGKTANFSALIAKAVDVGYRLIIVLSGIHNSLRQQTQRRLMAELVGYPDGRVPSVPVPPQGQRWLTITTDDLNGDFDPGNVQGVLQGTQPVLMVVKKNSTVLQRLQQWLDAAPQDIRTTLPVLVIDDEADQASINIGGDRPPDDDDDDDEDRVPVLDTGSPSAINALIRGLVNRFSRIAYVAYTATPFANVLIPHTAVDRIAGQDLYPRDFIVDLPKPPGYFGPEEIFGLSDGEGDLNRDGLNVIRLIPDDELDMLIPARGVDVYLFQPELPPSLENAMLDFVLAGAARRQRGDGREPATMLIHIHVRTAVQRRVTELIEVRLAELRDEWRYQREFGIRNRLEARWISEFRPLTRSLHGDLDVSFDAVEEHIGPFFEAIEVKQINSDTEDILDYQRDPELKVLVVGGNRLSRGLTLEGLLVSYYVRKIKMYDTLMQMGRWFGFRQGYEDLTRIHTTEELATWFRELATVEYQLREDIQVYENEGVTPLELGPRIRKHPAMLVTSRLKMRYAQEITIDQSYAAHLLQTTTFPFQDRGFLEQNIEATRHFIASLGRPNDATNPGQPTWPGVPWRNIVDFLTTYQVDVQAQERAFPPQLIRRFIVRQAAQGELTGWTVSIRGLRIPDRNLRSIDLGVQDGEPINCVRRTRLKLTPNSMGVITSPGDEETGLDAEQLERAAEIQAAGGIGRGPALRQVRTRDNGLLLIYPVSRYSRPEPRRESNREALFDNPEEGVDVIGIALSFPASDTAATVQGIYVVGTVGWRAM